MGGYRRGNLLNCRRLSTYAPLIEQPFMKAELDGEVSERFQKFCIAVVIVGLLMALLVLD